MIAAAAAAVVVAAAGVVAVVVVLAATAAAGSCEFKCFGTTIYKLGKAGFIVSVCSLVWPNQ